MAARDVLLMGVMLFALGLGFFIFHYAMNNTVDSMLATSVINSSNATVTSLEGTAALTNRLDYVIFGVFIGFLLGIIITGWFIGGHPIYMFIYFLVVMMAVVVSTVLSNVWEEVTAMTIFGTTIASFPITNNLLTNGPVYLAIVGIIGMIVMFGKPFLQQE